MTFAENLSEVDSITFVELMVTLQNTFKVKFQVSDFATLKTIQGIRARLAQLLGQKDPPPSLK